MVSIKTYPSPLFQDGLHCVVYVIWEKGKTQDVEQNRLLLTTLIDGDMNDFDTKVLFRNVGKDESATPELLEGSMGSNAC